MAAAVTAGMFVASCSGFKHGYKRGWGTTSTASVEKGIPTGVTELFTAADRQRLSELRGERDGGLPAEAKPTQVEVSRDQEHEEANADEHARNRTSGATDIDRNTHRGPSNGNTEGYRGSRGGTEKAMPSSRRRVAEDKVSK